MKQIQAILLEPVVRMKKSYFLILAVKSSLVSEALSALTRDSSFMIYCSAKKGFTGNID